MPTPTTHHRPAELDAVALATLRALDAPSISSQRTPLPSLDEMNATILIAQAYTAPAPFGIYSAQSVAAVRRRVLAHWDRLGDWADLI